MKGLLRAPRSRDSRDNGLLCTCRSIGLKVQGPKGSFHNLMGRGFETPMINVPTLFQELARLKGHRVSRVLKIKEFWGLEG